MGPSTASSVMEVPASAAAERPSTTPTAVRALKLSPCLCHPCPCPCLSCPSSSSCAPFPLRPCPCFRERYRRPSRERKGTRHARGWDSSPSWRLLGPETRIEGEALELLCCDLPPLWQFCCSVGQCQPRCLAAWRRHSWHRRKHPRSTEKQKTQPADEDWESGSSWGRHRPAATENVGARLGAWPSRRGARSMCHWTNYPSGPWRNGAAHESACGRRHAHDRVCPHHRTRAHQPAS